MEYFNLFDNRKNNESDFKSFMMNFISNNRTIEKIMRSPKPSNNIQPITAQDKIKFENDANHLIKYFENKCSDLQVDAYNEQRPIIVNHLNGLYFFPTHLYSSKTQDKHRFVRIYLGLHTSKFFEFFKEFAKIAKQRDIYYNYKFFNVKNDSCDRAVIYPNNDDFFKAVEIIQEIKNSKPYLFEGAVDKYFTTHICQGVGASSDLGYTLSNSMSEFLAVYISEILRQYQPRKEENRTLFFTQCLKNYYNENKEQLDRQGFGNNFDGYLNQLNNQFKHFIKTRFDLSCLPFVLTNNDGKQFTPDIKINSVQTWISPMPEQIQKEIIDKLTNYDLFQQMLPSIIRDLPRVNHDIPSKQNISFFSEEMKKLEQLKENYEEENKNLESNNILENIENTKE